MGLKAENIAYDKVDEYFDDWKSHEIKDCFDML